jgi:predicted unusual protein kinase regulating ubiquinone biosynthesis (AarF/ABC1/UbiB family)
MQKLAEIDKNQSSL